MFNFLKRNREVFLVSIVLFCLTLIYLFPLVQGLILLPLDFLVTHYSPWAAYHENTILVKNPYMQDSIAQMFPWKHLVYESFQNGILPLWNPYQFMGMPFLAGMKPMVFYPLNLFYIFGDIHAWHILLFSQIFLALLFTFLLARDFKLGTLPSFLVSFSYSLNALMMTTLEFGSEGHVLLWFPIFFLCAKRYLEMQSGKYLFFLGVSLAMSIFAGQLQYFGYGLILLLGFISFYGLYLKIPLRRYIFVFLSIILGIGISAIQLAPSIELFQQSYRGSDATNLFLSGLSKPYHLLLLLIPDAFGNPVSRDLTSFYHGSSIYFGIVPLFFCIYAIVFVRNNFFVKFFSVAFLGSLLLSWDKIGQLLYVIKIPLFTSGSAERELSIMLFAAAILSGFGLSEFIKTERNKRNIISIAVFTVVFFATWIAGSAANKFLGETVFVSESVRYPLLILIAFLILSMGYLLYRGKFIYLKYLFLLGVLVLTFFDLFRLGYRYLTFSNSKFFYPDVPVVKFIRDSSKDNLARSYGLTDHEIPTAISLYTTETYNPLYLKRTGLLVNALQKNTNDRLPVNKYFLSNGQSLKYTLDFLGVSYIILHKDTNPSIEYFKTRQYENDLVKIYSDDKYIVYQNMTTYPRFGLYYQAQKTKNDEEALDLITNNSINFSQKLLLEEDLPFSLNEGSGSAKLISSSINSQTFLVNSTNPGLFYITDTYYPGWHASVNNQKTKIYRANYNFRAVVIPKGNSIVKFTYLPNTLLVGAFVSVSSLLLLAFLGKFYKRLHL